LEDAKKDTQILYDGNAADWEAHLRVQKKQATNELDRYLSEDLYPQEKDFDILGWWKLHSPEYPVLSCIARDVLAIKHQRWHQSRLLVLVGEQLVIRGTG
jgi:hypothetical protein